MVHKGRRFFSQNLRCFCTIVDKPKDSETSLILYDGSNSLRLHKNPWRLQVINSDHYQNTSDDEF